MNLNIIGYCVYFLITAYIIITVGKICYDNGNIYVAALIPGHAELCRKINQILLLGYYLLNLGYCATTLIHWDNILNIANMVETIAFRTSIIICLLSLLHYFNIFLIKNYIQKLIH